MIASSDQPHAGLATDAAAGLPVVLLMGPTASGKTALACRWVDHYPQLEIVSVDSALIYRGMDIGTAKPSADELQQYPHHLIDLVEPEATYSVARFVEDTLAAVRAIHARGHVPLLAGGTMLYFRALLAGMSPVPETTPETRLFIGNWLQQAGLPRLYEALQQRDPVLATRLLPTDRQRITRALEVLTDTGIPLSQWQQTVPVAPLSPYRMLGYALQPERGWLHQRIEQRLDSMWQQGLVGEVEGLRQRPGLTGDHPAMRAVGYRQCWQYLDGVLDHQAMQQQALFATRQLAKRQHTWMRSLLPAHAISPLLTNEFTYLPL